MHRRRFLLATGAALALGPTLASSAAFARRKKKKPDVDVPVRGTDKARDKPAEVNGGPIALGAWRYGRSSTGTDAMLMFRGNPAHTFYGTGPVPTKPKVRWKHRMIDYPALYYGTPHVWKGTGWTGQAGYLDGYVFVGSQGRGLYAFEADSGKVRWRYEAGRMFKSSLCIYENRLYIGNVDDWLRCLDAKTGEVLWRLNTHRDLDSSPCVVDGRLYIAGENGHVRCLDPMTGEQIWKAFVGGLNSGPKPGSYGSETSPAVVDGELYTATYDGELFNLDIATGKKRWIAKTGEDTDASPVVSGDYVYVAAEEKAPYVYCFTRKEGKEVWKMKGRRGFWSTPAVVGDTLTIGGDDSRVYAVDKLTGREKWTTKLGAATWSSPAVVDDKLIIGCFDGNLYCLDHKTGKEVWKMKLGGRIHSTPIIINGVIYIGTGDGEFYAIEQG